MRSPRAYRPLLCYASWNTSQKKLKETKTGVAREIPVHPALAKVLAEWKLTGWAATFKRKPMDDDIIIPSTEVGYRSVVFALKTFYRDLEALSLRKRLQYDSWRNFISLALRDA